jgi:hypothetical protein
MVNGHSWNDVLNAVRGGGPSEDEPPLRITPVSLDGLCHSKAWTVS